MKTFSKQLILALFIATNLISCECAHTYSYEVNNNCSGRITIHLETLGSIGTILIDPTQTKTIFSTEHGIEACKRCPCFQNVDLDILELSIYKNDSLESKQNYSANESWRFSKSGKYSTIVTEQDF